MVARKSIRTLAVLLAMLAAAFLLPAGMQAAYADDGDGAAYTISADDNVIRLVDIGNVWTALDPINEATFTGEINPDEPGLADRIELADEIWTDLSDSSEIRRSDMSPGKFTLWHTYSYTAVVRAKDNYRFAPDEGFEFVYGGTEFEQDWFDVSFEDNNTTACITGFLMVEVCPVDISDTAFSDIGNQRFTGEAITPDFTVTMDVNGTPVTLEKDADYTVSYSNNTHVGTATITITGIGNYTGTAKKTFKIISAADLSVKSLWASKHSDGKVLFKWSKKDGVPVDGWSVKYRMRQIGGSGSWSGWTTKSFASNVMETEISIKHDWVIEIHAQGKGDATWSTGIITTPAGGKYQAMKYVHVINTATGARLAEESVSGSEVKKTTIILAVGDTIKVKPDYEYPVSNYTARPRLYPNQMLYDIKDKSVISITKPDGSAYTSGMIDGIATIKATKVGKTDLTFRAPNGRTLNAEVIVGKTYTFNGSLMGTDGDGNSVWLQDAISNSDAKKIVLKGTIQFSERYKVGSNTIIDASMGKSGVGAGATIYSASNGDGCLTNYIASGNYDAVKNITIKGGTWKKKSGYHNKTMMLFTHASNITIDSIYEECAYKGGHCVELVACKDVVVSNCNLQMKDSNPENNEDEPLQLDHANKVTSPTIPTAYQNNHACQNVLVSKCTLQGGRGFCSGHCGNDTTNGAQSVYHYNVKVKNCTITGKSSEALALYNVVGCEVSGNTIKSQNSDISSFRSDGMCVRIPKGSTAPADMASSTITIKNNKVYGGRSGIIVNSLSASDFGKVVITGNTVYYKGDAKNAITVSRWYNNKSHAGCKSKTISGNTTKKGW